MNNNNHRIPYNYRRKKLIICFFFPLPGDDAFLTLVPIVLIFPRWDINNKKIFYSLIPCEESSRRCTISQCAIQTIEINHKNSYNEHVLYMHIKILFLFTSSPFFKEKISLFFILRLQHTTVFLKGAQTDR